MTGQWESGTFVPGPTIAHGGASVEQIIDARTPPPSPGLLRAHALLHAEMLAASHGSAQDPDQIPYPPNPNNPDRAPTIGASANFVLRIDDSANVWQGNVQYCPPIGGAALTQHDLDTLITNARAQDYPFQAGVALSGLQAPLTQAEADFLNDRFAP